MASASGIEVDLFLLFVVLSKLLCLSSFVFLRLVNCFFHRVFFGRSEHSNFLTQRLVPTSERLCLHGQAFTVSVITSSYFMVMILQFLHYSLCFFSLYPVLELFNFKFFLLLSLPYFHDTSHSTFARIYNLLLNFFVLFNPSFVCHTLCNSLFSAYLIDLFLRCCLFLL